eukprot:9516044-Lingulodinium_polyedra.AAC.1
MAKNSPRPRVAHLHRVPRGLAASAHLSLLAGRTRGAKDGLAHAGFAAAFAGTLEGNADMATNAD